MDLSNPPVAALRKALSRTCIIVPAFNESLVIDEVLAGLATLPCTVVVVDDASTDDTYRLCLKAPVVLLRHACNMGQGAALQTGITYALRRLHADFIVTFDADGQHRIEDVVQLVDTLRQTDCDVALGSRFLNGSDTDWSGARRTMLRAAVWFTRLSTRLPVTDTHNGLRTFTRDAAARLDIRHNRMAHASEILTTIRRCDLHWCEVPVRVAYTDYSRRKGQRGSGAVHVVWDLVAGRLR